MHVYSEDDLVCVKCHTCVYYVSPTPHFEPTPIAIKPFSTTLLESSYELIDVVLTKMNRTTPTDNFPAIFDECLECDTRERGLTSRTRPLSTTLLGSSYELVDVVLKERRKTTTTTIHTQRDAYHDDFHDDNGSDQDVPVSF